MRHGISPDEFLVSILILIPKGHRVDTKNSSNYRAVALNSIYGKILDNIILSVQEEKNLKRQIYNSAINLNLQQLMIETIQYVTACHSPIFILYMDASKTFD